MPDTRPCFIRDKETGKWSGAKFHCWLQDNASSDMTYTVPIAIVELEPSGMCRRVEPEQVCFNNPHWEK